jgi:uncharacterized membrane protein
MAPLIVQIAAWAGFWAVGRLGWWPAASTVTGSLRFALAALFTFTAVAHFVPRTRHEMVRMVPSVFPAPAMLVWLTGVLELVGAVGLLIAPYVRPAALALTALLAVMFPANVHAARAKLQIAGREAMPLLPRLLLQIFWMGCLLWVASRSAV